MTDYLTLERLGPNLPMGLWMLQLIAIHHKDAAKTGYLILAERLMNARNSENKHLKQKYCHTNVENTTKHLLKIKPRHLKIMMSLS
jgi:hypothetical protein